MKIDIQIDLLEQCLITYKELSNQLTDHRKEEINDSLPNRILSILLDDFIDKKESTLAKMKEYRIKKTIPEFEKLSAECNFIIDKTIEKAKHYIGKEPVTITGDINRIVNEYQVEKDTITQEKRNEIYMRLVQHINFLTKKYKNK